MSQVKRALVAFGKKNAVMVVALLAAVGTAFLVPPDAGYLGYFDVKTLACLFCVLAVVGALKNIRFFYLLARQIVRLFHTTRSAILALVTITFIGSMLIANDMALLTFLPLGYFVLSATDKTSYMAFTFILQNIAANLGGMLTPFGNPQNLYLYTRFSIPTGEFMSILLMPFLLAVTAITVCCLLLPAEPLYLALFLLAIAIVFRGIPYWVGLIVVPGVLLVADRKALREVDYPLLLTFVFFFIFSGNLARLAPVRAFFSALLEKNTILVSILSCQCISNVPTAILLSQFTDRYAELLIGVNIGGVGTLVASLASLITYREYLRHNPGQNLYYLRLFTLFNVGFLVLLTGGTMLYRALIGG